MFLLDMYDKLGTEATDRHRSNAVISNLTLDTPTKDTIEKVLW